MLVAVVLGNRLNDDGSPTKLMLKRMDLAMQVYEKLNPSKIILSGGLANAKAGLTEAQFMYDYLAKKGIPSSVLVEEGNSMSTSQNAKFSVPLAVSMGATQIVVVTSNEHMSRSFLNPLKLFDKQLKSYPNVQLLGYSG